MSLRDLELLIKRGIYKLETGNNKNLIYDNRTRKYVGHVENGKAEIKDFVKPIEGIDFIEEAESGPWLD